MSTNRQKAEHRRQFVMRADEKLAAIIDAAAQEEQRPAGNLLLRIVSAWAQGRTTGGGQITA